MIKFLRQGFKFVEIKGDIVIDMFYIKYNFYAPSSK